MGVDGFFAAKAHPGILTEDHFDVRCLCARTFIHSHTTCTHAGTTSTSKRSAVKNRCFSCVVWCWAMHLKRQKRALYKASTLPEVSDM
jgi:hypothetical protein